VIKRADAHRQVVVPTERIGYLFVNALSGRPRTCACGRAIGTPLDRGLIIEALLALRPSGRHHADAGHFGYLADIKGYDHDLIRARR